MTLVVGVCLSIRDWRAQLQRHCRDHVTDLAVHLVRDGADLFDGTTQVVVVDDDTSWLSAPFVVRAREQGVAVVGIFDPDEADGHGRNHLRRLGVDAVLPATIAIPDLVDAIRTHRPDDDLHDRFRELVGESEHTEGRRIVAVGGPAGVGATEVSVALADLAARTHHTVLIDLDESHPSIARRLGLSIHPHIVTAVEAIRREQSAIDAESGPLESCLARPATGGAPLPFDVLAGLAGRDDWSLVRPGDAIDLLEASSNRWPLVLARVGPRLEDLDRWVDRFGVSRAALRRADRLVAVGEGSAVGLLRLVDWLVDAVPLMEERPIDVVLNRCPASAAARAQLEQQLREVVGERVGRVWALGRDRRVEKAQWEGGLVAGGSFRRGLRVVAGTLAEPVVRPKETVA